MKSAKTLFDQADKRAKDQGLDIFDKGIDREEKENNLKVSEKEKEKDINNGETKNDGKNIIKIIANVFRSKDEFKNYLKFVKSLFKKNTNQ